MAVKEKTYIHESELVLAGTESVTYIVPDDGKQVVLKMFQSQLNPTKDVNACIIWDYGGSESIVATKNIINAVIVGTGDGVKKLALVLTNSESSSDVVMGAECLIEEI